MKVKLFHNQHQYEIIDITMSVLSSHLTIMYNFHTQVQYQQPKAQPRPKKPVFRQEEEESREEDYDVSFMRHNLEFLYVQFFFLQRQLASFIPVFSLIS